MHQLQPHPQHPVHPHLLRKKQIARLNRILLSGMYTSPAGQRVRRYHGRAGQERLPLHGGHHGLGHAQGAELAIVEHDARRRLS